MSKTIYTQRDVEDLARRGIKEIAMTEDVYLTDIARERAEKLGITVTVTTVPSAPFSAPPVSTPHDNIEQVVSRVKADVIAKLGSNADAALIERIVRRVVSQLQ